jgi:cytochrome c-type biogenesis protein CcsB
MEDCMKLFWKTLPWLFVALFGAEILAVMAPKKDGEFHVREFARLPVLLNGRIQPIDSAARNSLLQIRSTGDLPLEQVPSWKFWHHPKKLKAAEWLLEVTARPEQADDRPLFLIHHPDLLSELKLQDKGIEKSGLRYYTFNEIRAVGQEIIEQGQKAAEVKEELRTTYQKQVAKLAHAVFLYHNLKNSLRPEVSDDFAQELTDFRKDVTSLRAAARAGQTEKDFDKETLHRVEEAYVHFRGMAQSGYLLNVPPLNPEVAREEWHSAGRSVVESVGGDDFHPAVTFFAKMATAYRHHRADEFNQAVAGYQQWLAPQFAKELKKGRAEYYYNDVKAFLHAMIIYIVAFVLTGGALLAFDLSPGFSESLRRSAFYLIVLALVVHTCGLVFRMVLEGRPPVTNLYSSAIFIGWGAVILGLVLERIYRLGIGNAVASLAGFVTLVIAHNLALGGDTMEMLRAVLDTNFWLATHVVVVTLGYASTFVAGLLAIIYIFLGLFTPILSQKLTQRSAAAISAVTGLAGGARAGIKTAVKLSSEVGKTEVGKALAKMVYGIVCFATLFSFTGTVLGGIWADQSWGRFWGWDPKENGALIIVLWNAVILHARWGGLVRDRGLMTMAVFGNIVTSFSWFGVNMLGIGLHSYGFMDAAFKWLMGFVGSQLLIIALGLLPLHLWASFRGRVSAPSGEKAVKGKPLPSPAGS